MAPLRATLMIIYVVQSTAAVVDIIRRFFE
jgi:hypothetical protein